MDFEKQTVAGDSGSSTETRRRRPGTLAQVSVLLESVSTYLGSCVELISMEGRLAALSLFAMQILALVGAGLLLSSWLLLCAALSVWLVTSGASLAFMLTLLAIVNALILIPVILLIRKLSRNLLFKNSRQHFLSRGGKSDVDREYQLNPTS